MPAVEDVPEVQWAAFCDAHRSCALRLRLLWLRSALGSWLCRALAHSACASPFVLLPVPDDPQP